MPGSKFLTSPAIWQLKAVASNGVMRRDAALAVPGCALPGLFRADTERDSRADPGDYDSSRQ